MTDKDNNSGFKTHIPEPRWQQIVSVILVVLAIALFVWLVLHDHKTR